jgi:hypothetical protein
MAKWLAPIAPFLVGVALKLSGYQNPELAAVLWVFAGVLVLWFYIPPVADWLSQRGKRVVISSVIVVGILWVVPLFIWLLPLRLSTRNSGHQPWDSPMTVPTSLRLQFNATNTLPGCYR